MFYYLPASFAPFFYRLVKWHYRKPRWIQKRGLRLRLLPSVFHPGLYLSTDILLDFALQHELEGKKVLELGCGSGFITLYLAKNQHTIAFASDINPVVVEGLKANAQHHGVHVKVLQSDLFDDISAQSFDFILINPPFYPKSPTSQDEYAFFAGEDMAYFKKLWIQIIPYLKNATTIWMILSENVKLDLIKALAADQNIQVKQIHQAIKNRETFFIYSILLSD